MNKFYKYLLPVVLLVIAFGVSTFINNQLVLFVGWIISLVWLNRVASSFKNKALTIVTTTLVVISIIWGIGLLFYMSAW